MNAINIRNRTSLVWIMKGTHIPNDNLFQNRGDS